MPTSEYEPRQGEEQQILVITDLREAIDIVESLQAKDRIDGVGFDLYDTLVHVQAGENVHARITQNGLSIIQQFGLPIELDEYQEFTASVFGENKTRRDTCLQETSLNQTYTMITERLLASRGISLDSTRREALVRQLGDGEIQTLTDILVPEEGAQEVLSRLSGRMPLGIYSNTPAPKPGLLQIAHKTGLTQFIPEDNILGSCDTGIVKPDARTMHLLASQMGISTPRLVYIGDRQTDVRAATNAGAIPILKMVPGRSKK